MSVWPVVDEVEGNPNAHYGQQVTHHQGNHREENERGLHSENIAKIRLKMCERTQGNQKKYV